MTFISSKLGLLLHRVIPGQMFVIICFTFEIYLKNVIIFLDEAYNLHSHNSNQNGEKCFSIL